MLSFPIYCTVFSVNTNIELRDAVIHKTFDCVFMFSLLVPTQSYALSGFVGVIGLEIYMKFSVVAVFHTSTVNPENAVPIFGLTSGAVVVVKVSVVPSYTYGFPLPVRIIVYFQCTYIVTSPVVPMLPISVYVQVVVFSV